MNDTRTLDRMTSTRGRTYVVTTIEGDQQVTEEVEGVTRVERDPDRGVTFYDGDEPIAHVAQPIKYRRK